MAPKIKEGRDSGGSVLVVTGESQGCPHLICLAVGHEQAPEVSLQQ